MVLPSHFAVDRPITYLITASLPGTSIFPFFRIPLYTLAMDEIVKYFKEKDPILFKAIRNETWYSHSRTHDAFTGLCQIIIGQQLSTKAAHSIFMRFAALFPRKKPRAALVLELTEETLRSVGLSTAKCRAVRNLADQVVSKELPLQKLASMTDSEVTEALVKLKGIGPWSAEMFLMFYLEREDIFSPGDQGLRTAIMRLYGMEELPSAAQASSISKRWSPYRSHACRILWAYLDNEPT